MFLTTVNTIVDIALIIMLIIFIIAEIKITKGRGDKLIFCPLNDDVKVPQKRDEDAGYDIYACFPESYIAIRPGETEMIPTGLSTAFDDKYVMILKERGSTGTKGMGQRAGVIDSGFRGEIKVPITNHSTDKILIIAKDEFRTQVVNNLAAEDKLDYTIIYPYEKAICQAVMVPIPKMKVIEMVPDEYKKLGSKRGSGMLGSSGK